MSAGMFLSSYLSFANPLQRREDSSVDGNFLYLDVAYIGQSLAQLGTHQKSCSKLVWG